MSGLALNQEGNLVILCIAEGKPLLYPALFKPFFNLAGTIQESTARWHMEP